ncbi:S1 family peptidase [Hyalangium rubrum]|uniref:Serine protease n=1 Tax=Hyalangium rubrum TaxID=3103134 RepID=A0ABU5H3N7_9BACT|nr:serine protease [Hyalangium sp. s54d21]MDY7227936.1 serine protease [Hyalangium sp. s54d21]
MNRFLLGAPALFAFLSCASAAPSSTPASVAEAPRVAVPVEKAVAVRSERPTRKQLVRRIVPHNVRLVVTEGGKSRRTASGVVIGTDRTADGVASYVITNAHAVDVEDLKAPRMIITQERQAELSEYPVEVVATGKVPEMDLALLRVPGVELEPAELADDTELELGEDVVVAACPFGKSLSLSGGMLSQVEWDRESKRPKMVKTDAPIGYGASGGGIFSLETGKLLAIVEGYRTAKVGFAVAEKDYSFDVPMPGETFAAPTSKVRGFLESKGYGRLLNRASEGGVGQTAQR